jgi:hypothetical protein
MLFIRKFVKGEAEDVRTYYTVPTSVDEIAQSLVDRTNSGITMNTNRILTSCVVSCGLATIFDAGLVKKDAVNAVFRVPTTVKVYVAAFTECNPESIFDSGKIVPRRIIISQPSFNGGIVVEDDDNPISSDRVKHYLLKLDKLFKGGVVGQFSTLITPQNRFLDKDTGERLVFVDNIDTPYDKQSVVIVDYRSYHVNMLEGLNHEFFESKRVDTNYIVTLPHS